MQDHDNLTDRTSALSALTAIFDGKWKLFVLFELAYSGEMTFGQIHRAIPGIRQKGLTSALRSLEAAALVHRNVISTRPIRVAYRVTVRTQNALPLVKELAGMLFTEVESNRQCA